MKVVGIKRVGLKDVYDISVANVEHYVLKNGVVTHNTGLMLASDNVWIISRTQDKGTDGLDGYFFNITIEKSRYVREKSKIPINVKFEGGISNYAGLLDIAMEIGAVQKPQAGWYSRVDLNTGEMEQKKYRAKDTDSEEFWAPVLASDAFRKTIRERYQVSTGSVIETGRAIDATDSDFEMDLVVGQ